ncbi:hypothetical protein M8J77_010170 [Diaphorina citri]|nr:hypothetical protein M8J77_010170 [Diaphorina citri]
MFQGNSPPPYSKYSQVWEKPERDFCKADEKRRPRLNTGKGEEEDKTKKEEEKKKKEKKKTTKKKKRKKKEKKKKEDKKKKKKTTKTTKKGPKKEKKGIRDTFFRCKLLGQSK